MIVLHSWITVYEALFLLKEIGSYNLASMSKEVGTHVNLWNLHFVNIYEGHIVFNNHNTIVKHRQ